MKKAVIFDFDGTICNTLPLCLASIKGTIDAFTDLHMTDAEVYAQFGPTEEGVVRKYAPDSYDEAFDYFLKIYRELHDMCPAPFPGMVELVRELKKRGILVAMVTGKGPYTCQISLEYYGIADLFETVETGSPTGGVKPDRIRKVLKKYDLQPEEVYYVGDAPSDVTAAREVGVETLSVVFGDLTDVAAVAANHPLAICRTVEELRKWLG